MSYNKLFNNIEDMLFSEPEYSSSVDLDLSAEVVIYDCARKSVRSRVFNNFIIKVKNLFGRLGRT